MKSQTDNVLVFNNLISNTVTQSMFIPNGLLYRTESQTLLLLPIHKAISPCVSVIRRDDRVFNY
jgi:hypothetical protein